MYDCYSSDEWNQRCGGIYAAVVGPHIPVIETGLNPLFYLTVPGLLTKDREEEWYFLLQLVSGSTCDA